MPALPKLVSPAASAEAVDDRDPPAARLEMQRSRHADESGAKHDRVDGFEGMGTPRMSRVRITSDWRISARLGSGAPRFSTSFL